MIETDGSQGWEVLPDKHSSRITPSFFQKPKESKLQSMSDKEAVKHSPSYREFDYSTEAG